MADENHLAPGAGQTSTGLLVRVQARDPAAWEVFAHLYGPLVYRWCRRAGLQDADAADVGQEVFRAVVGSVSAYRREAYTGSFRGWLRSVTRNKVVDFHRRAAAEPNAKGGSGDGTRLRAISSADLAPDEAAEREDSLLLLRRAVDVVLATCTPETRETFLRVVIHREDPTTVAKDLGVSVNAIYLATARVKRRLRDEFSDILDD